ncbi:MAG: FixH family protein [Phycisphaerales bacterium]|nr:FixH family protein [Phycisphaerales bacterium]
MKFNWGTGISMFFIVFAVSMISLVVATTKHPPQMVSDKYYDLDIHYEAHMKKKQNAAALSAQPTVRVVDDHVNVAWPGDMKVDKGQIKCFRSQTTKDDQLLEVSGINSIDIPIEKFASGLWHFELDWESAGTPYFSENSVMINR